MDRRRQKEPTSSKQSPGLLGDLLTLHHTTRGRWDYGLPPLSVCLAGYESSSAAVTAFRGAGRLDDL